MVKKKTKTASKRCVGCKRPAGLVSSVVSWIKEKTGMVGICQCK